MNLLPANDTVASFTRNPYIKAVAIFVTIAAGAITVWHTWHQLKLTKFELATHKTEIESLQKKGDL